MGCVVNATPRPLYPRERDPLPIVEGAGWALGTVLMVAENIARTGIWSPDHPARSQSLYRLCNVDFRNLIGARFFVPIQIGPGVNPASQPIRSTLPVTPDIQPCQTPMPGNPASQLCQSTLPVNHASHPCQSPLPVNRASQLCQSPLPVQPCQSPVPVTPASQTCQSTMPVTPASQTCQSPLPVTPASQPFQSTMPVTPASYTYDKYHFLGIKRLGRGVNHPTPSSAEAKERVQIYFYSPSGSSWSVLGWALPFALI
jgi:hypothetical protein